MAVTVGAIAVCVVGLVVTALRQPTALAAHVDEPGEDRVARAREAWRKALVARGIEPFLRDALADDCDRGSRPRYTGPDYAGPERPPE
ncbi:hypothetical protein [Streptomyces sp. NPDC005533]|uniref:hypothetical protein n=1 Tax=Streptomyces sp. NPDC005533 TaxID=3364723 RepID=UPI00369229FE